MRVVALWASHDLIRAWRGARPEARHAFKRIHTGTVFEPYVTITTVFAMEEVVIGVCS
jgi:hypothetical protein